MRYKSNMSSVINNLINDLKNDISATELSRVAAEQLLGDIVYRIHNEGKNAANGKIATSYSVAPIYVSIEGFVRQTNGKGKSLKPSGKNSTEPFKNGKKRKSRYFEAGYKEFKQEQTGNTQVNLVLTGQLQNDLLISPIGKDFGLSFGDYGLKIYERLENHYKAHIWYPTEKEHDRMITAINNYIDIKLAR